MANTYELISSTVVGSGGVSSISFTNIPQTFTDLVLRISGQSNRTNYDTFKITFNGSTADYSGKVLYGSGSGAAATFSGPSTYINYSAANGTNYANVFAVTEFYIPNYTWSNYKSILGNSAAEGNIQAAEMALSGSLWSSGSAISSIGIASNVGSAIQQYSTAYLYGIKKS